MKTQTQFTPEQVTEFSQWVSGLCRGRHDEWKANLLDMLLAARPTNWNGIQTVQMETHKGNTLQLFLNNQTGLVVVDLIAANEQGGTELLRQTIDEGKALAHTAPKTPKPRKTQGVGYQPKTGVPCSCKSGVQRDNCRHCEGTGMVIDHALVRSLTRSA